MFDFLPEVCRELNGKMTEIYWIMLLPFSLFVIATELISGSGKGPDVNKILRRMFISVLLLISLKECMDVIAVVSEGVAGKISGIYTFDDLCAQMKQSYQEITVSWLKFKEATIYLLSFCSYVLAYIGVFMSNALIYFVWSVLYVCAPLMILMYVSEKTAYVTGNLYKGLINVAVWKVLYSILGVMLLKFSKVNQLGPDDSFLTAIIVNICIAAAMLFTPFAVKSLLGDGMSGLGSALAMVPSVATVSALKQFGRASKQKFKGWTKKGAKCAASGVRLGIDKFRNNKSRKDDLDEQEQSNDESVDGTEQDAEEQ